MENKKDVRRHGRRKPERREVIKGKKWSENIDQKNYRSKIVEKEYS